MEIFGFFIGVWASIIIGLFFIAMVIGCTYDRYYTESPKWWILIVAIATFIFWQEDSLTWNMLWSDKVWSTVGWYLLIGLCYSVIEFVLEVRRSARYWTKSWAEHSKRMKQIEHTNRQNGVDEQTSPDEKLVREFLNHHAHDRYYNRRIIGVVRARNAAGVAGVEPKVNRQQLAEALGCWTLFWPFYAVSLIIGDLVMEIFRVIADLVANMSGRFVRMAFKDVFKL